MKKLALTLAILIALSGLSFARADNSSTINTNIDDGGNAISNVGSDEGNDKYISGDYEYKLCSNGTAEITEYIGTASTLVIPSELDGYPVTAIGDSAFYRCNSLSSVTIPDSVVELGDNPFCSCISLTEISVSSNHPTLATIDGVLFDKGEKKLVCYPCSFESLSYVIPRGILAVGSYAFYDCYTLSFITIPNSVTSIGDYAFSQCYSLSFITIPDSVSFIGDYAFSQCYSLSSIAIPDSVVELGDNPFRACVSLAEISVSSNHPTLATIDGVLFDKTEKKLIYCPSTFDVENYVVPQGTLIIGEFAFCWCDSLRTITLPEGVTSIGDSAFGHCEALRSIALPEGVSHIGDAAFYYCTALRSATIPVSMFQIGQGAFYGCDHLTSLAIPYGATSIGEEAFYACSNLTLQVESGSYAEQYAKENNIPYEIIESTNWLFG